MSPAGDPQPFHTRQNRTLGHHLGPAPASPTSHLLPHHFPASWVYSSSHDPCGPHSLLHHPRVQPPWIPPVCLTRLMTPSPTWVPTPHHHHLSPRCRSLPPIQVLSSPFPLWKPSMVPAAHGSSFKLMSLAHETLHNQPAFLAAFSVSPHHAPCPQWPLITPPLASQCSGTGSPPTDPPLLGRAFDELTHAL